MEIGNGISRQPYDQNTVFGSTNNTSNTAKDGSKTSQTGECETCKERKYQDGSNENVSYKAPTHIPTQAAASAVRAHEGEHVSNAYSKASKNNGEVIRASVAIHTGVCPECGKVYISGGTTTTQIKYSDDTNPYQQGKKTQDAIKYAGQDMDIVV